MSSSLKEAISLCHDNDIYLPTRTIFLTGEVSDSMHDTALKNLHALDNMSTNKTINIYINSEGGSLDACMAIYDAIRGCKNFVRGVVNGQASSSASLILQACDTRLITPSSYMLIHLGTESYPEDHPLNIKRQIEKSDRDEKWAVDVYLRQIKKKHPRYTKTKLDKLLQFDSILNSKEALELGLVDEIKEIF